MEEGECVSCTNIQRSERQIFSGTNQNWPQEDSIQSLSWTSANSGSRDTLCFNNDRWFFYLEAEKSEMAGKKGCLRHKLQQSHSDFFLNWVKTFLYITPPPQKKRHCLLIIWICGYNVLPPLFFLFFFFTNTDLLLLQLPVLFYFLTKYFINLKLKFGNVHI